MIQKLKYRLRCYWRKLLRAICLCERCSTTIPRSRIESLIASELDRAYAKHGNALWGRHEFYAILKEEVDEL